MKNMIMLWIAISICASSLSTELIVQSEFEFKL